jgi:hypothetical protein
MRVMGMFFESDVEWSSYLSGLLLLALSTGKLVYPGSIVFVVWVVIAFSQQSFDVISGGE